MISLCCITTFYLCAQSGGVQQYYFHKTQTTASTITPIAHYTTASNWYGEARYNYDEENTFSVYGGKTFRSLSDFAVSATPLAGGMIGKMNGGSVGLNMDIEFRKLFLSSQSQYSVSFEDRSNRYFFTWSEIGIQPLNWFYSGVACQQTNVYGIAGQFDPGYMIGFNLGKWTLPLYAFNPSKSNRYFIIGLLFSWEDKSQKSLQSVSETKPNKKISN